MDLPNPSPADPAQCAVALSVGSATLHSYFPIENKAYKVGKPDIGGPLDHDSSVGDSMSWTGLRNAKVWAQGKLWTTSAVHQPCGLMIGKDQ